MSDRFIKLVRDQVGDERDQVIYEEVPSSEFELMLREKLVEEAREFEKSGEYAELIDVFEVIWAWLSLGGLTINRLAGDAENVRMKRGSFLNGIGMSIRRPE